MSTSTEASWDLPERVNEAVVSAAFVLVDVDDVEVDVDEDVDDVADDIDENADADVDEDVEDTTLFKVEGKGRDMAVFPENVARKEVRIIITVSLSG